ncbi:MAG: polyribonucleotide nucleotidyltransferase [Saprospiraceae bacterium]
MGKRIPTTVSFNLPDGREVSIETGKLATQADGSVVVKIGKTMLFCTVVSAREGGENNSFFPLSVDYQEKFAAAGRIPGNFFKREARLSEYEILICRLVDRAIRPLFPDGYMNNTQIIINLISADEDTPPDAFAALAASAALSVSDINFGGPISETRVARVDGEFVVNPSKTQLASADMEIMVGATIDNVTMVEGEAKECSEADLIEAIKVGHEAIKVQCQAQIELAEKLGVVKRELEPIQVDEELLDLIKGISTDKIVAVADGALDKVGRKKGLKEAKNHLIEQLTEQKGEEYVAENGKKIGEYFGKVQKSAIREFMLSQGKRLDGRQPDEVRYIWTEVDYLPAAHGSAIFTRGETQALMSLTLGTKMDAQMVDTALAHYYEKFILHYNFPAFSVGEIKPMRGPGRREVGHANLAGRSLKQVLPGLEDMTHTIRLVSDVLESNGSSSMATVCAGSLALMDAGIPIKAPVSGIAMGMVSDGTRHMILTDILGDEDALGDMDFKVTGTENGITGCQMDIKIDGMPYELLQQALDQAKAGRLHILGEMAKTITESREELKPHAPKMIRVEIDKEFIGAIIGPGGKHIQKLQLDTGTVVTIEEVDGKGIVLISGLDAEGIEKARQHVWGVTYVPNVGDVFEDAVVATVQPYGVFVDFLPGKSGLVHISEISWSRLESLDGVLAEGDKIKVKIVGVDERSGKFRLSRKVLMERPEGYVERPPRGGGDRRDNRGGGDRRDNRGGGRNNDRRDNRNRR